MKNKILISAIVASLSLVSNLVAGTATDWVKITNSVPYISFDDTNCNTGNAFLDAFQWQIDTKTNANASIDKWSLVDMKAFIANGPGDKIFPIVIHGGGSSYNSLVVDTNGDINLANGSVFIDRSAKSLSVPGPINSLGLLVAGPSAWMAQAWLSPDIYAFGTNTGKIPIAIDKNTNTVLGITKTDGVLVNNAISSVWAGSSSSGLKELMAMSANNTNTGKSSDSGFSMKNERDNFTWAFRTYSPQEGFAATKLGTGGTEFEVGNKTTNYHNAVVKMGGVTVFTGGHLVTASSRTLKTDIKPLDTQAALDAFHKLQPISYEYKAHRGEPVVGFIAEDVPELVAMPSGKSYDTAEIVAVLTSVLAETRAEAEVMRAEAKIKDTEIKAMQEEITELKSIKQKVAKLESLLTNLALDSSTSEKAKVSMK